MGKDFRGSALMDLMEKSNNLMESFDKFSTTRLLYKLLDNTCLGETGKIKEEIKYYINIPAFKIQNSKFIPKPEDKFETMLFLPPNPQRKSEGGLRTKGFFKFSYKLVEDVWYICDLDGNPVISAPEDLQNKIRLYVSDQSKPITYLPLITVITVVLNGEKTLEETIKSVTSQTYPNVEYIIIDGGSKDGTLDIIKRYEDCIDYWVSEPDEGIYDAMNKGIKVASGHGILFLNSGDKLLTNRCFNNIKIPGFLYCKYEIKLGKVRINRTIKKPKFYKISLPVPHQAIIFDARKKLLYDTSYKLAADYDYFLRHGYNDKLTFIENSLVYFDNSGVSKKMSDLRDREILEIISKNFGRKYRVFVSSFFLFKNFIKVILNAILR
jgi:hypothetical protein